MKELEPKGQDPVNLNQAETRKQTHKVILAEVRVEHNGHSIWEVNKMTLEAKKIEVDKTINYGQTKATGEYKHQDRMFYTSALNEQSALWHFARSLGIKKKDFPRWLKVKRDGLKKRNDQQLRTDQAD